MESFASKCLFFPKSFRAKLVLLSFFSTFQHLPGCPGIWYLACYLNSEEYLCKLVLATSNVPCILFLFRILYPKLVPRRFQGDPKVVPRCFQGALKGLPRYSEGNPNVLGTKMILKVLNEWTNRRKDGLAEVLELLSQLDIVFKAS